MLKTCRVINDPTALWLVIICSLQIGLLDSIHFLNIGIAFLVIEYKDKDVECFVCCSFGVITIT